MTDKVIDSNNVAVYGTVTSKPEFSHEMYGEGFYTVYLQVPRLSDIYDTLPITISERLVLGLNIDVGSKLLVEGQLRSYNKYHEGNNKLILTVFARNLKFMEQEVKNPNQIYLDGYICKKPIYRTTPFGREITDMLLAVNRPYNKSDYIPCIAWGRNARYSENLEVGDRIRVWVGFRAAIIRKKMSEEDGDQDSNEVSILKNGAVRFGNA